ncbi:MAG: hypothetical protein ACK559_41095, partial [bacterium]
SKARAECTDRPRAGRSGAAQLVHRGLRVLDLLLPVLDLALQALLVRDHLVQLILQSGGIHAAARRHRRLARQAGNHVGFTLALLGARAGEPEGADRLAVRGVGGGPHHGVGLRQVDHRRHLALAALCGGDRADGLHGEGARALIPRALLPDHRAVVVGHDRALEGAA